MSLTESDQFQKRATEIGSAFREECQKLLENLGFEFIGKYEPLEKHGVQIELVYNNKEDISLFFEAAGTPEEEPASPRPGLERTDTVKKIIGTAYLVHKYTGTPIIVLTSHLPNPNSASEKMLQSALGDVIYDVICVYDDNDIERLRSYLTKRDF